MANKAMTVYKNLLQQQYDATAQLLTQGNIPFFAENTGALFFWIDLSQYLDLVPIVDPSQLPFSALCQYLYSNDDIRESSLATYILNTGNVQLICGQECFNTAPGFFRLCYTAAPLDQVTAGVTSMIAALKQLG